MTFGDLAAGDAVFVDANILTYHFQPHPPGVRHAPTCCGGLSTRSLWASRPPMC